MAKRRFSMRKIREVLRLGLECGLSYRQVAKALGISRPVATQYLIDFRATGLRYREIEGMGDEDLLRIIRKNREKKSRKYRALANWFEYITKELKKTGVTLQSLWDEYKKKHNDGYGYTQFCYHYQVWRNSSPLTMHIEHKAGEKLFVDFAGKKPRIYNRKTGASREVEVLVATLGASQYTYVEAVESQKKEDWIKANDNALWFFGGVTGAIVPDCLKTAVDKADKYEPDINPEYADFARHYNTVILPARPASPQDKSLVENAVNNVYLKIYAPLRNRRFYSLEELNEAFRERLKVLNNVSFQNMKTSRRGLFEETDKNALKPLPNQRYERKNFENRKVQFNYHVELKEDHHYYSVPWRNKGKYAVIIYTADTVEIYHNNFRIALHKRDRKVNGYTTLKEHMPPHHKFYAGWSPQRFINWGRNIGNETKMLVKKILESRQFPEQAYKVCLGILNLSKKYGNKRVNKACSRALAFGNYSYKAVKTILEKGLDKIQEEPLLPRFPEHNNIRGNEYFN